ncbi:MAG: GNAT family N-acetyltransferase [Lachnospiraceae bacterium]|nr:GNAT family N-acetyltransferase [Lachnospiraceae bacterium]
MNQSNQKRYEIRQLRPEEGEQAIRIEHTCFPPNEACRAERILERIRKAPELFLAAVDSETGKCAGMINGIATNEKVFRDEFFTDITLHNPEGEQVIILSVAVLPEHRHQGLAGRMMAEYVKWAKAHGRKELLLTCLKEKVTLYRGMGYEDLGMANSEWGGEEWHEMRYCIKG